MKPNMIKKWSIALLVAAGAAGLTGCEGMRVDEGSSTATNNGNVAVAPNGAALKANLSGNVVDDFGRAMSGVQVYAYGKTAQTDSGGNWILNNVPVTGVNINSTAQNLEQTTDVTTQGSIYVTYTKSGYAEYKSKISNPAVVTHYGTAGGNPNSIIVDNLVASESVQLPQLVNSVTGILIDRASYYTDPVGTYDFAGNLTVRLIPAVDVVNNAYGSAAQIGAGTTECYEGCGFYSVAEMVTTTDASGNFKFNEVPKIPGGYIMRVDQPGYRPMARPNDGTGFSYDYDDSYDLGALTTQLGENKDAWKVSVQADEDQNYWWGIDFDVKTTGTLTYLEDLYVGDFLVAPKNLVEGITVGGRYGTSQDTSGEDSDEGHNAALIGLAGDVDTNEVIVDANLVDLGVTPLKFIFSGDMIPHVAGSIPTRGIVVFDSTGAQLSWDTAKTSISGRTLTLQLANKPTAGTSIYVRLHKDVFADMGGKRLTQVTDPNAANYSDNAGGAVAADPAEIVTTGDKAFYGEYEIMYTDPLIVPAPVENFAQKDLSLGIPITASLTAVTADGGTSLSALYGSNDWRVEELLDAILVRTDNSDSTLVDTAQGGLAGSATDNRLTFNGTAATVEFTAVNNAIYRLRIRDVDGVLLTTMSNNPGLTGTAITGDEEDDAQNVVNITSGSATTVGSTFIDFQATVGSASTSAKAEVTLANAEKAYTAAIVRLNDFGDEVASSAVTISLADNFMPHVAIQNSNLSGQDTANAATTGTQHGTANTAAGAAGAINASNTAEMLFACGIERSDDNGEAEVGNAAYYFPKLNLSGSLYDKSNLRAHSEVRTTDLLSTAIDQGQTSHATAEDSGVLTDSLAVNARNTPLLAVTAATESAAGTTTSGRSDNYYTANDYDQWGLLTTVAAGPACQYYVAEISTNTGIFQNNWLPSTIAGVGTTVGGAGGVADNDTSQATVPIAGYTLTGNTFTYNLNTTPASTSLGNIIQGPAGCGASGSNVYDFDRTVVLNMTEATNAPADFTAFSAQTGVCSQNNVPTGELSASTGLTAIKTATSGWNNDHLLLTFDDWRTIDDSNHYTNTAEANVANELADGSSLTDLLQIVSLTDANGVAATAGNGRGVLIVDATPPIATSVTHNGSTLIVTFDQTVSLVDNGEAAGDANNEFDLVGTGGVVYNFNYKDEDADGTSEWTVSRTTNYIDRFGAVLVANDEVDITVVGDVNPATNVPSNTANSRLTITLVDPSSTAGASSDREGNSAINGNIDLSDFFNELSHTSTASLAATSTTTPSYYMIYQDLEDNNFNSWLNAGVETYDQYDDAGSPRLVGVETHGPRLQTVDIDADAAPNLETSDNVLVTGVNIDASGAYLLVSTGITITSAHLTIANGTDTDTVYTPSATGAITGQNTDTELGYILGFASGGVAQAVTTANEARLVIKTSATGINAQDAIAYIFSPDTTGGAADNAGLTGGTSITSSAAGVDVPAGATFTGGGGASTAAGEIAQSGTTLFMELPAFSPTSGDLIVIQNLVLNDHVYSLHIPIPAARTISAATRPSTTEAGIASLNPVVYRHVYLDADVGLGNDSDDSEVIRTGTNITSTTGSLTLDFNFRENIASVGTPTWTRGSDMDTTAADDNTVNFVPTAAVSTADAKLVTVTLDPYTAATGPVLEGETDRYVGENAQLSFTVTDHSSQQSTVTITMRKEHGRTIGALPQGAEAEVAILNTITGTSIQ